MGFRLVVVEIEEVKVRGGGMSILGVGHRVVLTDTGLELESLGREPGRYHGRVPSHTAGVGRGAGGVSPHGHGVAVDVGLLLGHDVDLEGWVVVRVVEVAVVDLGVNTILVVHIILIEGVAGLDGQRSSSGQGVRERIGCW